MRTLARGRVLTEDEWDGLSVPDIYFSSDYHKTSSLAEPDVVKNILLQWRDDGGSVYLPLMLRENKGTDYLDATSAYGYGGPWTEGEPDRASFREFFDDWAQGNNVVATFIRFHPLIENAEEFSKILPLKAIGQTAAWELAKSEDLIQGMAKNHRKSWRRAVRAGVKARISRNPENINDFRDLYELSMSRVSAKSSYLPPDQYWRALQNRLGSYSILVEAVFEDRTIAAVWCLVSKDYLHFHLSGTTEEGRRLGGAFICRVAAAQWAREAGIEQAHFGGGVGGEGSSLLDWKRRFDESADLRNFYVANVIHDEKKFADLTEGYPDDGYFPPWRNPERSK